MSQPPSPPEQSPEQPAGEPGQPAQPPAGAAPEQPVANLEQPEPRKRRFGLRALLGAGVAVVVFIVIRVVLSSMSGPSVPEAGECMTDAFLADDMEVVDCTADDAVWQVLGSHGSMTEGAFDDLTAAMAAQTDPAQLPELCRDFPQWEQALWIGSSSRGGDADGEVVCLAPIG